MKITILILMLCCPVLAQHRAVAEKPLGMVTSIPKVVRKPGDLLTWARLVEAENGDVWFYRPSDQLYRKGQFVLLWILAQPSEKPGYSMNLWAIRCDLSQISLVEYANYTPKHRLTYRSKVFEPNWKDIYPDTMFGETRNKVCRRRR